jgi:hypothetical protein
MPETTDVKPNLTNYFLLDRSWAMNPARLPDRYPDQPGIFWTSGARFAQPMPEPIEVTLKRFDRNHPDQSEEIAEYIKGPIPLFRDDLIEALQAAGVDNLDLYQAELIDPDNGQRYKTHKAVNVIGVIAAADLERSAAIVNPGGPIIDVSFDSLVLDETKARGALMFRLAEATGEILVHRSVRDHLEDKGFTKLWFIDPEDAAIL